MADNVRARFEKTIERGKAEAQTVLEQLDRDQPRDRIAPGAKLKFIPTDSAGVEVSIADDREAIHDHALSQFSSRVKLPMTFVRGLQTHAAEKNGAWAAELLAENLNRLYHEGPGAKGRYLIRSVAGETRACLSDRYRRLDSRPLFAAFYKAAIEGAGALPTRAYALATKTAVRVILPTVFEPIENEPMLYGLEWHNSDFGHGTHSLRSFVHRPWCTNEATCDDALRQIHLGKRLSEDFQYSEATYMLDQKTSVSALTDTVRGLLEPARIDQTMGAIKAAHEADVSTDQLKGWLKQNLHKGEAEQATEIFNSPDVENLPPGNSKWRLSNAISFLATKTENKYRAMELESIAGKLLAA